MSLWRKLLCVLGFHAGYVKDGAYHCCYCDFKNVHTIYEINVAPCPDEPEPPTPE